MSESLVRALRLPVHQLNTLIEAEALVGGIIPYVRYVEARLAIPGIDKMNKGSLCMVSNDSPYTKRVPLQIRTLHIHEALQLATKEEIKTLPQAWKTADFPPQALMKSGILKQPEFDLDNVKGHVRLTKSITIGPFQTIQTSGLMECKQHFKRVNVIVEPDPNKNYDTAVSICRYTVLKPGSSRVSISISNLGCRQVTIPDRTNFAEIAAANIIPHSYTPNIEDQSHQGNNERKQEFTEAKLGDTKDIEMAGGDLNITCFDI